MATLTEKDIQTYSIDPAHSRVGFSVRHMGFSKVRGSFERFEGVVYVDPTDLSSLDTRGTVKTDSITTGDEKRDEHLRSADFFDAETNPTITFETHGVQNVSGDEFTLEGDLTIAGVMKRVALDGQFLGEGKDPWGGTRIALKAQTNINRKEFGLTWNAVLESGGVLVSNDVEISLEIQAVLQEDEA